MSEIRYKGERVRLNLPALPAEHGREGVIYQSVLSTERLAQVKWDDEREIQMVHIRFLDPISDGGDEIDQIAPAPARTLDADALMAWLEEEAADADSHDNNWWSGRRDLIEELRAHIASMVEETV